MLKPGDLSLSVRISVLNTLRIGTSLWHSLGCYLQQLTHLTQNHPKVKTDLLKMAGIKTSMNQLFLELQSLNEGLYSLTETHDSWENTCEHSIKFAYRVLNNSLHLQPNTQYRIPDKQALGRLR